LEARGGAPVQVAVQGDQWRTGDQVPEDPVHRRVAELLPGPAEHHDVGALVRTGEGDTVHVGGDVPAVQQVTARAGMVAAQVGGADRGRGEDLVGGDVEPGGTQGPGDRRPRP
jgi:hypothetical protein